MLGGDTLRTDMSHATAPVAFLVSKVGRWTATVVVVVLDPVVVVRKLAIVGHLGVATGLLVKLHQHRFLFVVIFFIVLILNVHHHRGSVPRALEDDLADPVPQGLVVGVEDALVPEFFLLRGRHHVQQRAPHHVVLQRCSA